MNSEKHRAVKCFSLYYKRENTCIVRKYAIHYTQDLGIKKEEKVHKFIGCQVYPDTLNMFTTIIFERVWTFGQEP